MASAEHWDETYVSRGLDGVSWYQPVPAVSLALVDSLGVDPGAAVLDVGGGGSRLADELVARGFTDVTVLDLSEAALDETWRRLADAPVRCVWADVLRWEPSRRYGLWHDRAAFHFLVDDDQRARYAHTLRRTVEPGGCVIVGTFAADGPESCSGLPVRRYSAADLEGALGDDFSAFEVRREVHVTPSGAAQPFTWVAGRVD